MPVEKTSCLLLVNPASGGGKALKLAPKVEQTLRQKYQVRVSISQNQADLVNQIRQATESVIFLLAGDGSLQAAVTVIINERLNTLLCPLPAGRGNDFCAVLQISKNPIKAAAQACLNPELIWVDAINVNDSKIALGAISIGIDAVAAKIAQQMQLRGIKWLRGAPLYVFAALKALFRWKTQTIDVKIGEHPTQSMAIWLFVVSNSGQFGGGMKISPDSNLQDGKLEVVMVGEVTKLDFLRTFPKVFTGKHLSHPKVKTFSVTEIHLNCQSELVAFADGEDIGTTPLKIDVIPNAIQLMK